MICDKVKDCMEQTKHIESEKKKGKKRLQNGKQPREDRYPQPLSCAPCGDNEKQKKCIDFLDKRSQIKCVEKGKTYILDQSKECPRHEIIKFFVDKGIITEPEASTVCKCDNALLIRDSFGTVVLVELKGGDVHHAIKQLSKTLFQEQLYPAWSSQKRVFGRVVCKSTPPRIWNTDECMDLKETFLSLNGNLKIAEEIMVEKYNELGQRELNS